MYYKKNYVVGVFLYLIIEFWILLLYILAQYYLNNYNLYWTVIIHILHCTMYIFVVYLFNQTLRINCLWNIGFFDILQKICIGK